MDESELIGAFYDAAFDPALFPDRLRALAAYSGAVGATFWVRDNAAPLLPAMAATSGHLGDDAIDAYRAHYGAFDPYRRPVEAGMPGQWLLSTALFDTGFVARDPFSNEYLIPRGVQSFAAARLVAGDRFDAFVSIHREPGATPFSAHDVARLAHLGSHLERALKVYLELTRSRPTHDAALALLERAPPAALIDRSCTILFANPEAEALLGANGPLQVEHGRLRLPRGAADAQLQRLAADATRARAPCGGEMLIPRPPGAPPLALLVVPAGTTATLYGLAPVPAAMVLVHDPQRHTVSVTRRLQSLFSLSPIEAMVAQGLGAGKRLAEIAADRQVSIETVRTQLKAVFRKTGVSRQADLVRLLQSMLTLYGGSL